MTTPKDLLAQCIRAVEFLRANLLSLCVSDGFAKTWVNRSLRRHERKRRELRNSVETRHSVSVRLRKRLCGEISQTRFTWCIPSRRRTMPYARHWRRAPF